MENSENETVWVIFKHCVLNFSPTQGNILRYDRGSPALSNVQLGKAVVELVTDHQSVGI